MERQKNMRQAPALHQEQLISNAVKLKQWEPTQVLSIHLDMLQYPDIWWKPDESNV